MPRIRSTKPSFFRHEELQELEIKYPHAKVMLVFQGLWGLCDNQGRFEWRPKQIKLDILPFIPYDPEETLTILAQHNFIEKYKHDQELYGHVFNLKKHQRFSGKEVKEGERFPAPKPDLIIKIPKKEATGKHQGSNREEKSVHIDIQLDNKGSDGEAMGKQQGTQEKEKEKEKEKEFPETEVSASDQNIIVGIISKNNPLLNSYGRRKNSRAAPKKKNSDVEPFQELYVTIFNEEWLLVRKEKFKWQPKDFASIKKISKLLRSEKDTWDELTAQNQIREFIKKAKKHSFIAKNNFENFTYPMLLNYFNPINSINSNGAHQQITSEGVKGNSKDAGAHQLLRSLKEDLDAGRK